MPAGPLKRCRPLAGLMHELMETSFPAKYGKYSMNNLPELGRAVAVLRKQRNMTQKELATLSGLGTSTLARFETGGVAEFGSRKLLRLLEVLGHELAFTPGRASFTLDDALAERQLLAVSTIELPRPANNRRRRSASP